MIKLENDGKAMKMMEQIRDSRNEFHDLALEKFNYLLEEIDLESYYKRHHIGE